MIVRIVLASTHLLVAAGWFGAMCYSAFILHPRARQFFSTERDFEAFVATVSHGARWKVLGALALIALSGTGLVLIGGPAERPAVWWAILAAKTAVLLAAIGMFIYVSWHLWPARVLATPGEIPRFQRVFRRFAAAMIALATTATVLGAVLLRFGFD